MGFTFVKNETGKLYQMQEKRDSYLKGRGAQHNTPNSFLQHRYEAMFDDFRVEEDLPEAPKTEYIKVFPKSILNKVDSPEMGLFYSMNPYQGCEHGCIYCYARNSHEYWGYSAGVDFEQKILVKEEAPALLEKKLKGRNWKPVPIMLSGNTDCYQPIERQLGITRRLLEVLDRYGHPVGLITKNSLILRDIDILERMASRNLVHVSISLTSLKEETRRLMEPRTASVKQRLKVIESLSGKGIPVNVMMAPVVPAINDHEILKLAETVAAHGARALNFTIVRLNGAIGPLFEDWARKNFPDRADKILNQIRDCHGGRLNDSRFGTRMRGEGHFARNIAALFRLANTKFFSDKQIPPYNLEEFEQRKNPQMKLF